MHTICTHDNLMICSMEAISSFNPSASLHRRVHVHGGPVSSYPRTLKTDQNLKFNSTRNPSYMKCNGTRIEHMGVAYVHKRSIITPKASSSSTAGSKKEDLLGSITIFTATGEPVLVKDLWDQNNGMAVVALLRHFGCPCCWELASTLRDVKPKFDIAGVKLVAIGVGTPDKARILAERLPFPLDSLYADPDRKAYNALGLYFGFNRTFFNPASVKVFTRLDSYQKALKNYTISATPEDTSSVLQQGGMYVFKGKELLYARKDEGAGDHAPLDDVLNVCCTVPIS